MTKEQFLYYKKKQQYEVRSEYELKSEPGVQQEGVTLD